MKNRPIKESISHFSPAIPLKLEWSRGRITTSYPLAYHADYEIHLIKQGFGKYIISGYPFCFKPRQLVVIKPNQVHGVVPNPEHRIEKVKLMFPRAWQADFLKKLEFERGLPSLICLSDAQSLCIEMIANRIIEENARRDKGWEDMITKLIQEFLLWVNRLKEQRVNPVKEKPVLAQLHRYIESHYADPQCQVTAVAKYFGYSLNYITQLSKEMYGVGLKHYLQQYKIIAARRILESNPNLKVEAVARQVGFNQYRNFTRAFLMQTGMRASKYREFYHLQCEK